MIDAFSRGDRDERDEAFDRAINGNIEGFEPDADDLIADLETDGGGVPDADELEADVERVLEALYSRIGEGSPEPRLHATRRVVELLGDVHEAYPVVHVTGTNGKTSTSRMIESILRAAGLRTGLITSPHIERLNERIQLDGAPIDDERLVRMWDDVSHVLDLVDRELEQQHEQPLTFFEALTVLSLAVFADAPVDVAVIEVGMGGEWDSTNVVRGDVAVFTPIGLDHMDRLGNTLAEIAATKAGIVKDGASVVSAEQAPEALEVLAARAADRDASFAVVGTDARLTADATAVGGRLISVQGLAGSYQDLFLPLFGAHQSQNAALAIAAVEAFFGGERELAHDVLEEGVAEVRSPGRLEAIAKDPLVLIDAAHNPHGATALATAIEENFAFDKLVLVFGALEGKDAEGIIRALEPVIDHIVVTESDSPRARHAEELAEDVRSWTSLEIDVEPELDRALDLARGLAGRGDDNASQQGVLVAGSITVIGAAKTIAREEGWLSA